MANRIITPQEMWEEAKAIAKNAGIRYGLSESQKASLDRLVSGALFGNEHGPSQSDKRIT